MHTRGYTRGINCNTEILKGSVLFLAAALIISASAFTDASAATNQRVLSWAGCGMARFSASRGCAPPE